MIRFIILIAILLVPQCLHAANTAGTKAFKEALGQLKKAKYGEAVENFSIAANELPEVADYALLYIAKAYLESGDPAASLTAAARFLDEFPESCLRQEAMRLRISAIMLRGGPGESVGLLESYVNEYPADGKMRMALAEALIGNGTSDKAEPHLKSLYIEGGDFHEKAASLMGNIKLSADETLQMVRNLIGRNKYAQAEAKARRFLDRQAGNQPPGSEITEALALSLYRQKRYNESAALYLEVNDLALAASSYLRAGDGDRFRHTLKKMIDGNDINAAVLMIAEANELRRDDKPQEAIALLEQVIEKFPAAAEDALWARGWTYYTFGDLKNALETFEALCERFPSSRYSYWRAKALQKYGEDPTKVFSSIDSDDYYGHLARARVDSRESGIKMSNESRREPQKHLKRIDALVEAGLEDEAAAELRRMAGKAASRDEAVDFAFRLQDLGRYREAMLVSLGIPEEQRPFEIAYPLAFWPKVQKAARKHSMDPYLILSLMREESLFDSKALSPAGAIGLMQLMPSTAEETSKAINIRIDGPASIYEVENNIALGSHYLSRLIRKFDSVSAAIASYNAGESNVRQWLSRGYYESSDEFIEDIPYRETRLYIKRIITSYFRYKRSLDPQFREAAGIL